MKNVDNIKFTLPPEVVGNSFVFDHVYIVPEIQLTYHQQDSWEISYIISGRGVRAIGDIVEPFDEGEVIFIPPNIPHSWTFDESACDEHGKIENITIVFTNRLLEGLSIVFSELTSIVDNIQRNKSAISLTGDTLIKVKELMLSMLKQQQFDRILSLIRLFHLIAFSEDDGYIVGNAVIEDRKKRRLQNINLYVMNNYQRNITLDEMASFSGMDKSSFCVFFKRETGKSFFRYLTEFRIESSCEMLRNTTKSVAEICITSGFRDIPYYNRVFKRIKGVTPSQHRIQSLERKDSLL